MHRLFPDMTDRPAGRTVAGGAIFWPVYNRALQKERAKIAPQILQLTEELLK